MRVLHLVKTAEGARWAVEQCAELVRMGIEVHVALPFEGSMSPRWRAAGVTVHELKVTSPRIWRLADFVTDLAPDLIHSHFVQTTIAARIALGRDHHVPRLFQVPGPLHLEHTSTREAELQSAGRADWWAASCQWTRQAYLLAGVPADRVGLVYYGRDLFELEPRPPGKLRAELGLGPKVPIVGMVAYAYPPRLWLGQRRGIKGHEDLIDALVQVPEAHGVFVGGPWIGGERYARKIARRARRKLGSRAHFLGTRHDVPELYADFDVAVHPSLSENLGGAAESLALGVPTIATTVGGLPDLVQPHTGWPVPPRDPAALAEAIREVLSNPAEARHRARAGQELARQLLDVRACAQDLVELYDRMLA